MNVTKIKHFCSSKDTVKGINRQAMDWEKIFANYIYMIKNLYSEYIKNSQLHIFKWAKEVNTLPKKIYGWQISS